MTPAPGERLLRFVGDRVRFALRADATPDGWRALLRTNLGRAAARRAEIIAAHAGGASAAGASWRDVPMQKTDDGWQIELPLAEVGWFKAKAYLLDDKNWQHWPDGADAGISVHPNFARTANTIYCAFPRLFGASKSLPSARDEKLAAQIKPLDAKNFTVIPPSGKLRDLTRQLPHIVQTLGCRILHLLPVHPTPTTYARFGRYGSPYAALDLTAVDPALVEFDKRATGVDQFCELTFAAHSLGARVFIDIVIHHTGWGSTLQETHPEFFLKKPDGEFASPGAWGTTWEDLVELEQGSVLLWDIIADSLLVWCRRGVDGFRCDAGYKIPVVAWQYIVARVQEEFPETIFLLEGLGGSWEATEALLTEGGMQWAYSELFQNYSGKEVAWYLDYANRQSERIGSYLHYSETHDNDRLAKKGRAWSLLRNRLCALTSPCGGFGFTCGVEWLAAEKILVHGCTGLNWDGADNIVPELARLNGLISNHPCFFDGAKLTRLSAPDSAVYALLRESAEGKDVLLVLANTDDEKENSAVLNCRSPSDLQSELSNFKFDLLGQPLPKISAAKDKIKFTLPPGAVCCLAPTDTPAGLSGDAYRRARAQAAFAVQALNRLAPAEIVDGFDWRWLAEQIERSPENFLTAASRTGVQVSAGSIADTLKRELQAAERGETFPTVVTWTLIDARRVTPVPAGHWLLIEDSAPFRATLSPRNPDAKSQAPMHVQAIPAGKNFIAAFPPLETFVEADLRLERYAAASQNISAAIRFYAPEPTQPSSTRHPPSSLVLLTNGRGGMARLCADLGRVNSKYDCALGANLHPEFPVDRHVFVKRLRVWVNADGFLSPLDSTNLASFHAGPPAVWQFVANAGDGRTVEIELRAEMIEGENTVVFQFSRPTAELARGKQLPAAADVRLTVRADIEDRNFHSETKRNGGEEHHFSTNTHPLKKEIGFSFTPATDRQLRVFAGVGEYHSQPEWCENIPHPVEQSRGQVGSGDAYSPGWFELPMAKGADATLTLTAETETKGTKRKADGGKPGQDFAAQLERAAKQFVVRRGDGKTVIAGYPWFLDWGRDTFIACRGLLAAGMAEDVRKILLTFAKFEKDGTLPNTIHGNDVSNRDTSDAPLWFALAVLECADVSAPCSTRHVASKKSGDTSPHSTFYETSIAENGRTLRDVLTSIAENYMRGTPNGIHMDSDSALIWSPAHFTWMDTNFPAGTPREGYPVEIQALWIRLLRLLERISEPSGAPASSRPVSQSTAERAGKMPALPGKWRELADRATASLGRLFWLEDKGWFADVLLARPGVPARDAQMSDALRSNCLFAVSLGVCGGDASSPSCDGGVAVTRAKRCVAAAEKYLVVPGALRSLAPLPVSTPLPIYRDAQLLNNPIEPYWPRYEGDEDTRRKPAYHNGTAWTWTFPSFCEALARAWDFSPAAVAAAKSYLGSAEELLNQGCLGQLPEILDGDAPHLQRGCDAQAWGVTETLRVWRLLSAAG